MLDIRDKYLADLITRYGENYSNYNWLKNAEKVFYKRQDLKRVEKVQDIMKLHIKKVRDKQNILQSIYYDY